MATSLKWDTTKLDAAMARVSAASSKADAEIVTRNASTLLSQIARNTPRDRGFGRGGWQPAWDRLSMSGHVPGTRYTPGDYLRGRRGDLSAAPADPGKRRVYRVRGGAIDERDVRGSAAFSMINRTSVAGKRKGRWVSAFYYLYATNYRGKSAGWMQDAADAATFRFEQIYEKMIDKEFR